MTEHSADTREHWRATRCTCTVREQRTTDIRSGPAGAGQTVLARRYTTGRPSAPEPTDLLRASRQERHQPVIESERGHRH